MSKTSDGIVALVFGYLVWQNHKLKEENQELTEEASERNVCRVTSYSPYRTDRMGTRLRPTEISPSIEEFVFDDKSKAIKVMEQLNETANCYGQVSLGEYYQLVEKSDIYPVHYRWGWTRWNYLETDVVSTEHGYRIALPELEKL